VSAREPDPEEAGTATPAADSRDKNSGAVFRIGPNALRRRRRNLAYGAGLSLLLILVMLWANGSQPQTYNDVLLWSMIGFLVLANIVGYARYRRYRRLAARHRLVVDAPEVRFETGDTQSVLQSTAIAAIRVYRGRRGIGHIQILRTDNRGIRLEDYDDMKGLAAALKTLVPAAHWQDGNTAPKT
jgi:hypothetical protein